MFKVAGRDAFEVRADAPQFGSDETIYKMQAPIKPAEQLVPYLIVNRKRDLGAIWSNFSKINDAYQGNIPAYGLEGVLICRLAINRKENRMRLKAERTAKAEIDCFG
ncbi:MAG: hypothetical protein DMF37_01125 [Verrucomicrobia bacterium]|nr:MAG: hypothetical protein DMF37_01125 [Verrucomicrobiota bacterium]